jgi:hypothetical protein
MLLALLLTQVVSLSEVSQVKDLCAALREQASETDLDPAEIVAARKAALARRDEAAARWYRVEVPSKGFSFGQYRERDKQIELDGDRPLKAVDNTLSLDLEGVDDVAFHATPEQVSAWSKAKKAGALKLVVVFRPNGDRCAGSAAAEAWRLGGKVRSWEMVGEKGVVASADAEGDPVSGAPKAVKVEKVSVESDAGPADDDGRGRLSGAQHLLDKCVTGAPRGGSVLLAFSVQGGRVHEPQVIMDSLHDDKVTACVAHAVNGAEVGGNGRGSAAISLE